MVYSLTLTVFKSLIILNIKGYLWYSGIALSVGYYIPCDL